MIKINTSSSNYVKIVDPIIGIRDTTKPSISNMLRKVML